MTAEAADALARRALGFDPALARRPRSWLADPLGALGRLARPSQGVAGARQPGDADADDEGAGEPLVGPARPRGYAPRYAPEPTGGGLGYEVCGGIACIEVTGPLMDRGFEMCGEVFWGYDLIAEAVRAAHADPSVRGLFIRMESPGGVVAGGLEEAASAIREVRATGNEAGKPVWVFADMAASAAYWLAAQADRIIAPPVGLVGSIGAVLVHYDLSAHLAQAGVAVTAIQFGARKTDGAEWRPLSEAARADLQAEIDQCGRRFVADVVRGRPLLTEAGVLATEAAVYLALHDEPQRSGLHLNLVDDIAGEARAYRYLAEHLAQAPVQAPVTAGGSAPAPAAARPAGATRKEAAMASRAQLRRGQAARIQAARMLAMTPDEQIARIREILDAPDMTSEEMLELIADVIENAPAEEPPVEDAAVDDMPDDAVAEGEEEDKSAALARAKAILGLPEAVGREPLARELAFSGLSVKAARAALAAAPRRNASAARLAEIPDVRLGDGGAGPAPLSADERAARFVADAHAAAVGRPKR